MGTKIILNRSVFNHSNNKVATKTSFLLMLHDFSGEEVISTYKSAVKQDISESEETFLLPFHNKAHASIRVLYALN